ncbi:polysaccharide biosynthesis tyrosine autokinase [Dysgonomonas sp. Marseille-P4677]|uniref:GumC family protein n=1 Tax=Dysgonomonas sp. Marseille-P4677 TaxID=2364790 RepID=UPI0019140748|nr:polysaccharide biosynthesis tyrosine autokinase [Dysgonomonas sp. Marseille-P4677]MBK5721498.1 polysaccharide biosynthesis tyrosine autokinase [Dysgonomonas sp. Marseille-P4677]
MTDREFLNEKGGVIKVDFRRIGIILWNMKYVFLVSILLCLMGAYFYIRYTTPIYKKNITVVLKNQQTQYTDNYQLVSNTLGVGNKSNSDNQIFIFKSTKLMSRVVELGNFNVRYFSIGRFIDTELYKDSPIEFSFSPKADYEKTNINLEITFSGGKEIIIDSLFINDEPASLFVKKINFGEIINTSIGSFNITAQENIDISKLTGQMRITRSGVENAARSLSGSLEIISSVQPPDALTISLKGREPKRIEDILNMLVDEYNILTKENDSQSILGTISFLDERIMGLEDELKEVEGSFAKYRTANELVDLGSQSQLAMTSDHGYKERSNELQLQLNLLANIKKSFDNNVFELIPANIGITDGTLNSSISQYNQYIVDRNQLLAVSSENNPRVQVINDLLIALRGNIKQSIDNLEAGYKLQLQSTTRQKYLNQRDLVAMPSKQLALTRMSRLQQVKEPLYILLQQKREEALLMLSSLSNQAYVVDKAFGPNFPIYPKGGDIYVLALIIAVLVPSTIILIMNVFRSKILFEKDIAERTNIPLLGVIPSALKNRKSPMKAHIITAMGRDPLTESFRMLRTKLDNFAIKKKKQGGLVLQVSSSVPWEGKSFVSINMSLSLAYLGKKVLLVGADLHKPALSKYLGISSDKMGLSTYLAGTVEDIHQVISTHESTQNLDIIPAGPMPLNPSELLSLPLFEKTLDGLRNEYDYIIIDSAPLLMVSSGFIISKYADCTLYIVRSDYTKFSTLDTLNDIVKEGSLESVMLILNAVSFNKKSIYGINSCGQRYGYGYGYGYVEHDKK